MTEITGRGVNGSGAKKAVTVPVRNGKASYAERHNIASHFIGGNKLENAPESSVKDFVAHHDGHTVITNVSFQRLCGGMQFGGVCLVESGES